MNDPPSSFGPFSVTLRLLNAFVSTKHGWDGKDGNGSDGHLKRFASRFSAAPHGAGPGGPRQRQAARDGWDRRTKRCVLLFSVLEPLGDCWQPTGFAWRDPICFDSDWTCDDVCDLRLIRFCILCTFKRMRLSVFSFPSLFINQVESGHDRGLPLQTEVRRNARLGSTRKGADRGLGSLVGAHVDGNWWLFVCC